MVTLHPGNSDIKYEADVIHQWRLSENIHENLALILNHLAFLYRCCEAIYIVGLPMNTFITSSRAKSVVEKKQQQKTKGSTLSSGKRFFTPVGIYQLQHEFFGQRRVDNLNK